jgi:hypothetical protein
VPVACDRPVRQPPDGAGVAPGGTTAKTDVGLHFNGESGRHRRAFEAASVETWHPIGFLDDVPRMQKPYGRVRDRIGETR